jgi:hypothetical protein
MIRSREVWHGLLRSQAVLEIANHVILVLTLPDPVPTMRREAIIVVHIVLASACEDFLLIVVLSCLGNARAGCVIGCRLTLFKARRVGASFAGEF